MKTNMHIRRDDSPCDPENLGVDEACFLLYSTSKFPIKVWYQVKECIKCEFQYLHQVLPLNSTSIKINTNFGMDLFIKRNKFVDCSTEYKFEDQGVYGWNITDTNCSDVYVIKEPSNQYLPILGLCFLIGFIGVIWNLVEMALESEWYTRLRTRNAPFAELENDLGTPSPTEGPSVVRPEIFLQIRPQKNRVVSLDVFRGLSITVMIFVNYGGGGYWFFKHSIWNGLTVADLVFPWFLWIMGVSMVISLRSHLRSSIPRRNLFVKVLQRSVILVILGVILNSRKGNGFADLENLRFPGVLQRIGLTYFIVGTIETLLMKPQGSFRYGRWIVIQDILDSWVQWIIIFSITATHVLLTFLLPVPGCPVGYLGPGGLHDEAKFVNCTGGAAGYIDRLVFGSMHIYQRPTCKLIYNTVEPFDPEGLLGLLTSVLLVYLGVQAGRILLCYHYCAARILRWTMWATLCGLIAGGLCDFSKENGVIPVNKNLWSLSYVLALGSMAFLLISFLYLVIDHKHWWSGRPFHYAGMNSILLYIGHELTKSMFPWGWQPFYENHAELLAMNLWGSILWVFISYILFRKNIFLTI